MVSSAMTGASDSATDRCWCTAAGSESPTVVPSAMVPRRAIAPAEARIASRSVVFPAPEWPTSTTFRISSGRSAETGAFAAPLVPLPDMSSSCSCSPAGRMVSPILPPVRP
ncbi:hypothetical protein SA2016_0377 [Sinomonas atrocyanea]|uniref:Uncharacterized protein n=1 Tax=Sinomonas atrocyanea TaxID=37927 RepID=A0A126ZXE9_9MICC|nr:hypothetical protein SA2016_0377 [Sinomonas atrocyanea]